MFHLSPGKCQSYDSLVNQLLMDEGDSMINIANDKLTKAYINPNEGEHFRKLDSLTQKLTFKLDSLSALKLSDTLSRRVARLRTQLDSLKSQGPAVDIRQAQVRIASVQEKLSDVVKGVETKINEKLNLFSRHGGNIPGSLNLPVAKLDFNPGLNTDFEMSDLDLPSINNPLSEMENPLGNVDNPLESVDSEDLNLGNDLGGIPKIPHVGDLKTPDEVKKIQEKLSKVHKVSDQVKGYQEDLQNLKEGDLGRLEEIPDAIEERVENLEQLDGLKEEIKNFDEIKKKWNDPEVLKEEVLNKAKETAVNHFAGHEEQLKAVMEKMSKLKAKIPDPEGAIDLFAKRQQFLKGKPIKELLVPGLTLQFQNLTPKVGASLQAVRRKARDLCPPFSKSPDLSILSLKKNPDYESQVQDPRSGRTIFRYVYSYQLARCIHFERNTKIFFLTASATAKNTRASKYAPTAS